jgi:[acyl-carrier-protein] S-malonyltransferase
MLGLGAERLVEIGPGKVLAGLAKRAARGTPAISVQGPEDVVGLIGAGQPDGSRRFI